MQKDPSIQIVTLTRSFPSLLSQPYVLEICEIIVLQFVFPGNSVTTVSGAVLLCGYLIFDSFTANWQNALFKGILISALKQFYFDEHPL